MIEARILGLIFLWARQTNEGYNLLNIPLAVREDRMPGGRHRHKSQTQDIKADKGKKRRSSKENSCSPGPCSSCSDPGSPRSPTDDIDVNGMLSKYRVCFLCASC